MSTLDIVLTFQLVVAIIVALFVAYNVFHYVLFLLVTQPKDASRIGHELNQFEQRQLIEWAPQPNDFLKHDDEKRTYDDVFGTYRDEQANYSTCIFPRVAFSRPYEAEYLLLKPKDGMRLLDLGCGSGAAAYYLASRRDIEIVCVTNSSVQADICRRKFAKLGGRGQVIVSDFDRLDLPSESFDAIYALESIGYTKDLDAWLERCWRMLKPGGRLLIRSPGSLDHCRTPRTFFGEEHSALSLDQAYEVQFEFARLRCIAGDAIAGYKMGCTGPGVVEQFGMAGPIHGCLFRSELRASGDVLEHAAYVNLAIEGEMAVRIAADGTITAAFPVIELHHFLFRGSPKTLVELVANNGINARVVVSDDKVSMPHDRWKVAREMTVMANESAIDYGELWAMAGGAIEAVRWLREDLARHGVSLAPGDLVLTGTPLGLHAVRSGDKVSVSVDGRELVTCRIA